MFVPHYSPNLKKPSPSSSIKRDIPQIHAPIFTPKSMKPHINLHERDANIDVEEI